MTKFWVLSILLMIVLTGCFLFSPEYAQDCDVFYLTDLDGNQTTSFSSSEDFYMMFNLLNNTNDSLPYGIPDSGPRVRFYIYQNDSLVSYSESGYYCSVVVFDTLAPGEYIQSYWKAPNRNIPLKTSIVLEPGSYKAVAEFPHFEELQTDTITAINFTVVE